MVIAFDGLAEALANSYEAARPNPETLRAPADLDAFLARHKLAMKRRSTAADLQAVRDIRKAVIAIFEEESVRLKADGINRLLAGADIGLTLETGGDRPVFGWRIGPKSLGPQALRAAVALNLAVAAKAFGPDRFRICDGAPCRDAFIDTSRKGARRFCGPQCASRVHVGDFRQRRKASEI